LTAKVESTSHSDAWANVDVWIDHGFLKIHFEGPYTRGSLIYNSFNSFRHPERLQDGRRPGGLWFEGADPKR
jgi:hypothetical protein